MHIMKIRGLSKRFGGVWAVRNFDMDLLRGKVTSLIGPNGAGKSTIINMLSGFLPCTEGTTEFEGVATNRWNPHALTRVGLVRTFQHAQVMDSFTVTEGVMVGAHAKLRFTFLGGLLQSRVERRLQEECAGVADEVICFVGLNDRADVCCKHLSYGEKRLVELARALATQPRLILLDEPAAGLNNVEREKLISIIGDIKKEGVTVLLIEHDMRMVMDISDYVVVLNFGEKIAEGEPAVIQNDPKVIKAYLGGTHEHHA